MEALRILMDEHQSLAGILHAIRYLLKDIEAGKQEPDFNLFKAMVNYLDTYAEKQHHQKEERYLFAVLRKRSDQGADILDRLSIEHAGNEARIHALAAALERYAAGAADGRAAFTRAFDNYASFYRQHMQCEEQEILPLIRQLFTSDDWAEADAGFRKDADPLGGIGGDAHYRALFSRLVAATPAPIGLGAGPYKDE